jgi:hypothetical protein
MFILYIYSACWRMKLVFYERQHLCAPMLETSRTLIGYSLVTS